MSVIQVAAGEALDERDVAYAFIHATGPGGQHVNKVATAVQARYNPCGVRPLPPAVLERLRAFAGSRMAGDNSVVVTARRFRSQEQNRRDALQRLLALLRLSARQPRPRRATRPTRSSRERRLHGKRAHGQAKALRRRVRLGEE
jgi:ribosome-associated protein